MLSYDREGTVIDFDIEYDSENSNSGNVTISVSVPGIDSKFWFTDYYDNVADAPHAGEYVKLVIQEFESDRSHSSYMTAEIAGTRGRREDYEGNCETDIDAIKQKWEEEDRDEAMKAAKKVMAKIPKVRAVIFGEICLFIFLFLKN